MAKISFYCIYVLYNPPTRAIYVGYTSSLRRRLHQHRAGKTRSTKNFQRIQPVHIEYFIARSDAMRREAYLKTEPGDRHLRFMISEALSFLHP